MVILAHDPKRQIQSMEGAGFVISSADGVRLAIVEGRDAAFAAARLHDLKPLSVH